MKSKKKKKEKPEDSPYWCRHCKRVIAIAFLMHMWDMHGERDEKAV